MDVRINGAWVSPSRAQVRIGNAWRTVTRAQAYIGGAWRTIATFTPPLTLSLSATSVSGFSFGGTVFTNNVTVTPSGGQAPYTYAWVLSSGDGEISYPTAATTNFYDTPGIEVTTSGQFICTVTNALGSIAVSDPVTATFFDYGGAS